MGLVVYARGGVSWCSFRHCVGCNLRRYLLMNISVALSPTPPTFALVFSVSLPLHLSLSLSVPVSACLSLQLYLSLSMSICLCRLSACLSVVHTLCLSLCLVWSQRFICVLLAKSSHTGISKYHFLHEGKVGEYNYTYRLVISPAGL